MIRSITLAIGIPIIFVATIVGGLGLVIELNPENNPSFETQEVDVTTTVTSIDYDKVTGEIKDVRGPIPPEGVHEGNVHLFGEKDAMFIMVNTSKHE